MRFYAWLDKLLLGRFDKIVAVSGPVERELLRSGIARIKVENIPNGIDFKRFDGPSDNGAVRQEFGIPDGFKVVGTVGRLTDEKGHIYLIRAAKKVVKEVGTLVFLIVGDGPDMSLLKEKAGSLPFTFTGIRSDMPRLYSAMDVFVLPSLNEGLPMVLLEAMASKKPVIATRVGNIPEVLAEGVNGILIRAGREDDLAGAILELLKDEKKQKQLGASGYRKVIRDYSSAKMAEHYMKAYKTILEKRQ
jgi:glycosyltransferase involved in cell wall biosynthesis